ncbi:MAG: hypothetical protein ACJ71I_14415 [Nitrososphaeraceae archaeon]
MLLVSTATTDNQPDATAANGKIQSTGKPNPHCFSNMWQCNTSLCDKLFAVHLLNLVSYSAPLRSVYNIIDFVQHEYKLG